MQNRRPLFGVAVGLVLSLSPALRADVQVRTQNFLVQAPDNQTAQDFGHMAEQYRKQKAMEWLGQEMPPWPRPCPLIVKPTRGSPGGATKFNYDFRGGYEILSMEIEGNRERMLNSVLPHEITHTVFAYFFRYPVPRWADEGGSVLSEDDRERQQHDKLCRDKLNYNQSVNLRRLFTLKEYNEVQDVMVIYVEGFSVSQYLVNLGGRQNFLKFVAMGMQGGVQGNWDRAAQQFYQLQSVEALEQGWLKHLRDTKGTSASSTVTAWNNTPNQPVRGDLTGRTLVRQTAPPAQPQLDPAGPVVRGQSGDETQRAPTTAGRPTYLPNWPPDGGSVPPLKVPSPPPPVPPMPPVRLGVPDFGPPSAGRPAGG